MGWLGTLQQKSQIPDPTSELHSAIYWRCRSVRNRGLRKEHLASLPFRPTIVNTLNVSFPHRADCPHRTSSLPHDIDRRSRFLPRIPLAISSPLSQWYAMSHTPPLHARISTLARPRTPPHLPCPLLSSYHFSSLCIVAIGAHETNGTCRRKPPNNAPQMPNTPAARKPAWAGLTRSAR